MLKQGQCQRAPHRSAKCEKHQALILQPVCKCSQRGECPETEHNGYYLCTMKVVLDPALAVGTFDLHSSHDRLT